MDVVFFSNITNNTGRFVDRLEWPAHRIPLHPTDELLKVTKPYILIFPTYAGGRDVEAAVPKQVIKFLNDPDNRALIRGVVASGNTNFGDTYCRGGDIVSQKCEVPVLHRFELLGSDEDVSTVLAELHTYTEMESNDNH